MYRNNLEKELAKGAFFEMTDVVSDPPGRKYDVELPTFIPVLQILDQRWNISLLRLIASGVTRFNELRRRSQINPNTLHARLKEFEEAGLIYRKVDPMNPQKIEYVLTSMGTELAHIVNALAEWTDKHYGPAPSADQVADGVAAVYTEE